jgi:hypothetical protein
MKATEITDVSNDGRSTIEAEIPYVAEIRVKGVSAMLFHRWSVDGVAAKASAAKGSKAKKEDDLESYVYRDAVGQLAIPTEYFRQACIQAAKFKQDPRSPRKSAMDLFKAALFPLEELCSLDRNTWDFVDRRRVMVQRNAVTRSRPGVAEGWDATLRVLVVLPEYVRPDLLNEVLQMAGRVIGVGDFRPTFGRFQVTSFETRRG